jgi:hypothetical protein
MYCSAGPFSRRSWQPWKFGSLTTKITGVALACFSNFEVAKLLLGRQDIDINNRGETPLYWACGNGYLEIHIRICS